MAIQERTTQSGRQTRTPDHTQRLWRTLFIGGLILAIAAAVGISYIQEIERFYILAGVIGVFIFTVMFFRPEIGAYLLIVTVFTNMSDLLTESGLPSINQPLVAAMLLVVLGNLIFAPNRLVPLRKISRIEWALLAYVLVVVLSYTVARNQVNAYDLIIRLVKNVIIMLTIFLTLNTRAKVRTAIRILILTITFLSLIGTIQSGLNLEFDFFGLAKNSVIGQLTESGDLRYGGPIGLSNVWGQVLVTVLPFFVYRVIGTRNNSLQEIFLLFSTLLVFLAILLTGSRGAFVALLVILPLMAIELRIRLPNILVFVAIGLIILLMLPSDFTSRFTTLITGTNELGQPLGEDDVVQSRLTKMRAGMEMFYDHPFLGIGIGNYTDNYWDYADDLGIEPAVTNIQSADGERQPHSPYVEILAETGVFGMATFALFLVFLTFDTYKVLERTRGTIEDYRWKNWVAPIFVSLIAYMISGIFLHGVGFRWFWLIAALGLSAIHLTDSEFEKT